MGLVVDDERILPEKSGMKRTRLEPRPIAAEEEATTDHVDGADDNRRSCRIGSPLGIVGQLAPQSADRQRQPFVEGCEFSQSVPNCTEDILVLSPCRIVRTKESLAYSLDYGRRLIHDRSPVYDVDKPSRNEQ